MTAEAALRLSSHIREEVVDAADRLLTLLEQELADVARWRAGDADALDRVEAGLCAMLEICAFGDLVGQRLGQLDALLASGPAPTVDPLLNGPAALGDGIDQAAADRLMGGPHGPDAAVRE